MSFCERTSPEANERATMFVLLVIYGERSSNKNYANFVRDVREQFYLLETRALMKIIGRTFFPQRLISFLGTLLTESLLLVSFISKCNA